MRLLKYPPVRCWLAYNLIIMTINVAGSWNFHLDIIKPSAVLVLTMLSLAFNLGITANTAPAGIHAQCPVAILKQKIWSSKVGF